MKIRQATLADAAIITELNIKLAAESEDIQLKESVVLPGVKAILADKNKGEYFVAEIDGAIAGQLMITYEWSDWRNGTIWWLQSVYVREQYRAKGVFRALFENLKRLAHEGKEVCSLRLYMHKENARARQSYERMGMNQTKYEVFEMELER